MNELYNTLFGTSTDAPLNSEDITIEVEAPTIDPSLLHLQSSSESTSSPAASSELEAPTDGQTLALDNRTLKVRFIIADFILFRS